MNSLEGLLGSARGARGTLSLTLGLTDACVHSAHLTGAPLEFHSPGHSVSHSSSFPQDGVSVDCPKEEDAVVINGSVGKAGH